MKHSTVLRIARLATISVLSVTAADVYAAKDSEHPGTTPDEMRYKGALVPAA